MTRDQARDAIVRAIRSVAPEADPLAVAPGADLRTELDLDSVDFLNVVLALHAALGIDIPERDYPRLATLAGAIDYLVATRGP